MLLNRHVSKPRILAWRNWPTTSRKRPVVSLKSSYLAWLLTGHKDMFSVYHHFGEAYYHFFAHNLFDSLNYMIYVPKYNPCMLYLLTNLSISKSTSHVGWITWNTVWFSFCIFGIAPPILSRVNLLHIPTILNQHSFKKNTAEPFKFS